MTFPSKDKLLGFHLQVKNSTLLEDSHAENIHSHHPPNLSTIIGDSRKTSVDTFPTVQKALVTVLKTDMKLVFDCSH